MNHIELHEEENIAESYVKALHELITKFWNTETVPEEWRRQNFSILFDRLSLHVENIVGTTIVDVSQED